MLVVFPQGLWYFSLACQIIAMFANDPTPWLTVAFYCAGGGLIGAILAAVPGFIDLFSMNDRRIKNIGITHMVLNLSGVVVWAIIWYLLAPERRADNTDLALLLSIAVSIVLFYSAWLGGDMVHRHRVAVREEYEVTRTPAEQVRANNRRST
jgi:uncharacterized membrane protein